jgi:hypothetical protein
MRTLLVVAALSALLLLVVIDPGLAQCVNGRCR